MALVGASECNPFARNLVRNMTRLGFAGRISYVNPQRATAFGAPCRADLESLDEAPDCVAISVPATSVPSIVARGLALGVRAFVVNSAGFAETDAEGVARQREIEEMCVRAGAELIGPNCMGLVSLRAGVGAFGAPLPALLRGPVGVVSQSGSAAIALMNAARGIGFSHVISTGNEAVVTAEDVIERFLADDATRVVVAFLEAVRRPERFVALARSALADGKPIILLKVGRSSAGAAAALTHTGALVGAAAVAEAAFREAGVVLVRDLDELLECAELFANVRSTPTGGRTALLGLSGGELALAADIAEAVGLPLAELRPETASRVAGELARPAAVSNPIDLGLGFRGSSTFEETCGRIIDVLGADPGVDIVAVAQDAARAIAEEQVPLYAQIARGTARGASSSEAAVVFFTHVSAGLHDEIARPLRDARVPVLQGASAALRALAHLGRYGARRARPPAPPQVPRPERFRAACDAAGASTTLVGERTAKRILAAYGVPVTRERLATTASEARAIAEELGYPVVLKVESPEISHKTDVGGVRLGLRDSRDVDAAFADILDSVTKNRPGISITGILVAEHVPRGIELFVGVQRDPAFGPIVAIGLGGILVETLASVGLSIPPTTQDDALALLGSFPGHAVFGGVRGRPACDLRAAADAVLRIATIGVDAGPTLRAIDVNPLVVGAAGEGVRAVDARIVLVAEE